jgi:broad specificity phosphatase PhoE
MDSKFIWIRHANKKYANGKGAIGDFQHDSPIKEDVLDEIGICVENLLKYGFPTHILYSPFLRTRQTKDITLNKLKLINPEKSKLIKIEHDLNISEFLGFQKPVSQIADVEQDTLKYFPYDVCLGESLKNLNIRVRNHITSLNLEEPGRIVWIFTHGIVQNNIYYILNKRYDLNKKIPIYPSALSHVYFTYNFRDNAPELEYVSFE